MLRHTQTHTVAPLQRSEGLGGLLGEELAVALLESHALAGKLVVRGEARCVQGRQGEARRVGKMAPARGHALGARARRSATRNRAPSSRAHRDGQSGWGCRPGRPSAGRMAERWRGGIPAGWGGWERPARRAGRHGGAPGKCAARQAWTVCAKRRRAAQDRGAHLERVDALASVVEVDHEVHDCLGTEASGLRRRCRAGQTCFACRSLPSIPEQPGRRALLRGHGSALRPGWPARCGTGWSPSAPWTLTCSGRPWVALRRCWQCTLGSSRLSGP